MKSLKMKTFLAAAGLALLTAIPMGCPTWRTEHKVETTHKIEAHIVLDIRRIQDTAAQVEGEVRQPAAPAADGKPADAKTGDTKPVSNLPGLGRGIMVASASLAGLFDLAPRAAAGDPASDEREAIDRRKLRFAEIDKWLTKGCLGENNRGLLEARPCSEADAKAQTAALIKDENTDRQIVYTAIAGRQGGDPVPWEAIGEVFALEIVKKMKSGQPFQVPAKDNLFEEFKKTPPGKALSSAVKGEWTKMP